MKVRLRFGREFGLDLRLGLSFEGTNGSNGEKMRGEVNIQRELGLAPPRLQRQWLEQRQQQ